MTKSNQKISIRPLSADDLEAVITIDASVVGRLRRGFFERRLKAAMKQPKEFIYVGADIDGKLQGFALVRLISGEFGHQGMVAILDALGVDTSIQQAGIGSAMMAHIDALLKAKNITEMHTQSAWGYHGLMRFLDKIGFVPAPRLVLARDVGGPIDW